MRFAYMHLLFEAHRDAVWGVKWTSADAVVSISADGSTKKWDAVSGQISSSQPPHTLGLVSLDVDASGQKALYNTLEGLTCLWDLEKGDVLGKFESYARTQSESTEPGEYRCKILYYSYKDIISLTHVFPSLMPVYPNHSVVRIYQSKWPDICCYRWLWKCDYPLC